MADRLTGVQLEDTNENIIDPATEDKQDDMITELQDIVTKVGIAYIYIKATGQAEGDLHLSDATNWAVSKALIKTIRIVTASTDWDLYILQNDNGHAADDANIPELKLIGNANGNQNIYLDLPYEDEDASSEVHLYYLDNLAANTADIYLIGYKMR